jgi:hypothetical protein
MWAQDEGMRKIVPIPRARWASWTMDLASAAPRNQRRWTSRLIYGSSSNPRNDEEDGKHIVAISDIVCGTASCRTNRRQRVTRSARIERLVPLTTR